MMTLCLLLSACSGTEDAMQPALKLRTGLFEQGGCSYTAAVRADFGNTITEFTADCTFTSDGMTRVEITQPDTISQISAIVSADGATVEFDGILLDFGELAGGHVAPVAGPSILSLCWLNEYIDSAGKEADGVLITYLKGYDSEELTVLTHMTSDGIPYAGEVIYDGTTVLFVTITDFTYL